METPMNVLNKEKLKKLLLKTPSETFGISYPTMKRYLDLDIYPAELCKRVEDKTEGQITAVMLRPDIFTPTPAMRMLATCCVDNFEKHMGDDKFELIIAILNYFENQSPVLYEKTLNEIAQLRGGKVFVNQRVTRKQYEI